MKTIAYPTNPRIDKEGWPPGEWDHEPDKLQWQDEATGLPCLILRNRLGALCGYVGVPRGHKYYEVEADSVGDDDVWPPAHGGLTYAGRCQEGPENEGICHVVEDGEDDDVWWLGFDCLHSGDQAPGMMVLHGVAEFPLRDWETYKPLAYVQGEIKELAAWLKAA